MTKKKMNKEEILEKASAELNAKTDAEKEDKQEQKTEQKKSKKSANKSDTKSEKHVQNEKKKTEQKIITVKDLESEFGLKGKIIRRYLRNMEENTKPKGPQRYEWFENSEELASIRKNLQEITTKAQPR